jgi:hypothetical protein
MIWRLFARIGTVCGFAAVACACGDEEQTIQRTETAAQMGDTCGFFQLEPPGSSTRTQMTVVCPPGMVCRFEVTVYPPDEPLKRLGVCIPQAAISCDVSDVPPTCPAGLGCRAGAGIAPPGECFVSCLEHHECRGPYQVCSQSSCGTVSCKQDADVVTSSCPAMSHCERAICVKDVMN